MGIGTRFAALNFEGLCVLYEYRPMICRLAGISHTIIRPDGTVTKSGGCMRYHGENQQDRPNLKIDRTDFYRQMAAIEIEVVRAVGKRTASRHGGGSPRPGVSRGHCRVSDL